MAATWQWPRRDRRKFWDQVRTLARDVGQPVVQLLEIPGAFMPGASKALEKAAALFGSGLNVSELDSPEVLQPLDGVPGPFASADGASPVFIDGLRASLTVSHDGKGAEQILLERIDLPLLDYRRESVAEYEVAIDATRIFGAGFIEPLRFMVELGARGPGRARRTVRGADGKNSVLEAASDNFLDTEPASFFTIGKGDPPVMLRLAVTARDPGLYTICLRLFYRVAGRELRQHTSLPLLVYRGA
jgi:hypothetical protein